MKIRMTETYLIEADSIEELEEQYADDHLESCNSFIDFESVSFKEVKEYEDMVTIPLKQYTELVEKALRYDLLRRREEDNKFLSNDERILYGFAKKPESVFVAKPEEASKAEDDDF